MRSIATQLALAAALVASPPLSAQVPTPGGEEAAVRTVIGEYLHGLKFNDTLSLGKAFWPEAHLFYVNRAGAFAQWTQASWYATFAGSAGHEEQGDLRIAALEVTRDIATVKVVEDYAHSRYTDYLSLLRIQGRWWIVSKVYTSAPR